MKKFTNSLIHETSPYLLQHAHNPVNWFAWGSQALQKAKQENKPILVSIGYSACHWCHVMENESFEDESTAALMNEYFINIKIDREERPDIDAIYMDAVQAITGSGGWPLNVFLTPEAKPFFGGTYFPPKPMYNKISWKEVLINIHTAFAQQKSEIYNQAENLTKHLANANLFGTNTNISENIFTTENEQLIANNILQQADEQWGGFGNAPKFPQTFSIQYLLRHYHFTKNTKALKQALLSLNKMIYGGINDQLQGGFARYSTDEKWLAPHFEKMLYDNALIIGVLSEAYQITKNQLYKEAIHKTVDFLQQELLSNQNGFYSALDADSEGVEGKFYTWSKTEIENILQDDAEIFCQFFNVQQYGNWEHTNILWQTITEQEFAQQKQIEIQTLQNLLSVCKQKLLAVRHGRIKPQLDDKILLSWNALTITALCKAYAATSHENFKQLAINNFNFLKNNLHTANNGWQHTYKNGLAKINAFLDDYAYLIQALIYLQEITGNENYLLQANEICVYVIDNFIDEDESFFYYTHKNQQDVIVRKKEVYDGATPSANAVMANNLQYLSIVFNNHQYLKIANTMVQSIASTIIKYPTSFGVWASYLQNNVFEIKEIVLAGQQIMQSLPIILQAFMPNKVIQVTVNNNASFPLLKQKFVSNQNNFYLCKKYNCSLPFKDVSSFLANV